MQGNSSELAMIFNDSYARVTTTPGQDSGGFFAAFYKLFSSHDEVAARFQNTDQARQVRLLRASVVILVAYYGSGLPDSRLQKLAELHGRRGVDISPHLYSLWLDCLIDTVRRFDPKFNDKIENAWRVVFKRGIDFITSQYAVE